MILTIRRLYRALAWLILVGLAVEVYLVGTALFRVTTFEPHKSLGDALGIAILLLLVLVLIADRRRRVLGLSTVLFALTIVQVALPSLRSDVPWVAALHAFNALLLMLVTREIALTPQPKPTLLAPADSGVEQTATQPSLVTRTAVPTGTRG